MPNFTEKQPLEQAADLITRAESYLDEYFTASQKRKAGERYAEKYSLLLLSQGIRDALAGIAKIDRFMKENPKTQYSLKTRDMRNRVDIISAVRKLKNLKDRVDDALNDEFNHQAVDYKQLSEAGTQGLIAPLKDLIMPIIYPR